MKKKLEADLMSIAHRVLQMKNKSDINQLCVETRKLYEKLAILQFVEEHFEGAKPTIGQAEVVAKMKPFFEENHETESNPATSNIEIFDNEANVVASLEEEVVIQELEVDEIAEESSPKVDTEVNESEPTYISEEIIADNPVKSEEFSFLPAFELDVESEAEPEVPKKLDSVQISFEELLGTDYTQTHFVRVEQDKIQENPLDFELPKVVDSSNETDQVLDKIEPSPEDLKPKNVVTIEKHASVISIGLNDRIAFVQHLFGNSTVDYNRVMSQLITFDSLEEVQNFINDMVKPDYGDWQGKEEYEQRFMEIIEKKFA